MQPPLAPEKWKRQYPCFDGVSDRGAFFTPDEKSSFARMQLYEPDFICHWIEVWIELKGHSFEVYEEQDAKEPVLVFDLKQTHTFAAAKGLPGSAPDLKSGRLAVFSRYYFNKTVTTNSFFFELPTPQDCKAWLFSLNLNREWALRQSALQHPLGSCQVFCEHYEGRVVIRKRFSNTTMTKSEELHRSQIIEGKIEKLGGSRLEGRFQGRELLVKGKERLEYSSDGGVKGDIDLKKARVVLVCNDVLTKSKARKKPKPTEAMEHVGWWGLQQEESNRLFVFRTNDTDLVERWCVSMSEFSHVDRDKLLQTIQMKEKQALKNPARKVRYVGHSLPESAYGVLPRDGAAINPGKSLPTPQKDSRHKSEGARFISKGSADVGAKSRPVSSIGTRGALPSKPTRATSEESGVSPRSKSPRGPSARSPAKSAPRRAASPVAEPEPEPEPNTAFQRLRRATQMMKSSSEARSAMNAVKGGGPPSRVAPKGPSQREIEEQQKAETRRLAALERKKLREERERMKRSQQTGDDDDDAVSAAEVRALQAQLEAEIERRAAAEATTERLREKMESDKGTARELKQLAKDYRAKFETSMAECEQFRGELEELQQQQELLMEEHDEELQMLRRQMAMDGGGAPDAVLDEMTAEINDLKDTVARLKSDSRAQDKEIRGLQKAIQELEKEKETLIEENDLLMGEVENAEEMQEAVEGILALGDPAELVAQLEELLVENDALNNEVASLKKKLGRR